MLKHLLKFSQMSVALLLAGCDVAAMGGVDMSPTVPVNPGPGKSFASFQYDSATCKKWADQIMMPVAQQVVNAAVGTMVIGAAFGPDAANANAQSINTAAMVISPQFAGMNPQQQFDIVYAQCMYANGDDVPGFEANKYVLPPPPGTPGYVPPVTSTQTTNYSPPGPASYSPYAPPAGAPPPPPPPGSAPPP